MKTADGVKSSAVTTTDNSKRSRKRLEYNRIIDVKDNDVLAEFDDK